MPIAYSHDWYANKRILDAEDKAINLLLKGGEHTTSELIACIGENKRMLERVLASIRRYEGFTLTMTKKHGETRYRLIYNSSKDPYVFLGVKYAN